MKFINDLKSTCKPFDFKLRCAMIFHQAIKRERGTIVDLIIKLWKKFNYPLIELVESNFNGKKPISQAGWYGSIICLRLIVSAGADINYINNTNETILDTIQLGKIEKINSNPFGAQWIENYYQECHDYIINVTKTINSQKEDENKEEIVHEKDDNLALKDDEDIALLIMSKDNLEESKKYFDSIKDILSNEKIIIITKILRDEAGIIF